MTVSLGGHFISHTKSSRSSAPRLTKAIHHRRSIACSASFLILTAPLLLLEHTCTSIIMGNCGSVDSSSKQVIITSRKPPVQCEGYVPALIPQFLTSQEIVDFYLTYPDTASNETRQLACGLIRCMDNKADRTKWTWVQSSFDIDSSKPVIIVCHGHMAWRNQMLLAFLAANLSRKLNCHTLRFDFTGNGHSNGTWHYGGYDIESQDLSEVIRFVREQLKCRVSCVIGHSKGVYSVLQRAWEQEGMPAEERIPCFVNLSATFYTPNKYKPEERFTKEQLQELEMTGKLLEETRGQRKYEIRSEDIEEKIRLDSSPVSGITSSRVLTIHGDADDIVDVSSAYQFSDAIKPHKLKIIKGADHAFNGLKHVDELTDRISKFVGK